MSPRAFFAPVDPQEEIVILASWPAAVRLICGCTWEPQSGDLMAQRDCAGHARDVERYEGIRLYMQSMEEEMALMARADDPAQRPGITAPEFRRITAIQQRELVQGLQRASQALEARTALAKRGVDLIASLKATE